MVREYGAAKNDGRIACAEIIMEVPNVKLPVRKKNRLPGYDYSRCGTYFITICTHDHKNRFWTNLQTPELSHAGMLVETAIMQIPQFYPNVILDHYVVMPNHVHILMTLTEGDDRKKLETIVGQMKRWVTKRIGKPVWQKGFHDHIIRDDEDYAIKWEYTDTNPLRWQLDREYYQE